MSRVWQRWQCPRLGQLVSFYLAGAGNKCVAWAALVTEPEDRKPWARGLPAPIAKAVGGVQPERTMGEIAPAIIDLVARSHVLSAHLHTLPLETIWLRREDHQWWELTVRDSLCVRGAPVQSRRLSGACEAKFLDSI